MDVTRVHIQTLAISTHKKKQRTLYSTQSRAIGADSSASDSAKASDSASECGANSAHSARAQSLTARTCTKDSVCVVANLSS